MTHHWLVVIPIIIARPDTQYNNPGTQLDLNHENDGATVNNEVAGETNVTCTPGSLGASPM